MATHPVAHKLSHSGIPSDFTQGPLLFLVIAVIVAASIGAFLFVNSF